MRMYFSKIYAAFVFILILLIKITVSEEFGNNGDTIQLEIEEIRLSGNIEILSKNGSSIDLNKLLNETIAYKEMFIAMNNSFIVKLEEMQKKFEGRERIWEASLESVKKEFRDKEQEWKVIEKNQEKLSADVQHYKRILYDYVYQPGSSARYKLYTTLKTGKNAQESCDEDGAQLAIVRSKRDEEILATMMKASNVRQAWINGQRKNNEWVTVKGRKLEYLNWGENNGNQEPYQYLKDDCLVLYGRTGMGNWQCNSSNTLFSYICEI